MNSEVVEICLIVSISVVSDDVDIRQILIQYENCFLQNLYIDK